MKTKRRIDCCLDHYCCCCCCCLDQVDCLRSNSLRFVDVDYRDDLVAYFHIVAAGSASGAAAVVAGCDVDYGGCGCDGDEN